MEIADRQGVEVLCCPWCAGIWLSAGTLEKIVNRTLDTDAELEAGSPSAGGKALGGRKTEASSTERRPDTLV